MTDHITGQLGTARTVGYQRISTVGHITNRQLDGVELDEVFTDRASSKDTNRPRLQAMIRHVCEGDEVVVHSLDRLATSLDDLRRTVGELAAKGVHVRFLKEGLTFGDASEPCAAMMLSAMSAVGDFERALLQERHREEVALAKNHNADRMPQLDPDQAAAIAQRLDDGESASALAREYGVSLTTIYEMHWREADVVAVDHLYRQHGYPLDASHRLVDLLARRLKRTPTAVAERMVNLHGAHSEPGYPGTRWRFTRLDRKVADRKQGDW